VFDVAFSPCGNYMAGVDNFGRISLFSVGCSLEQSATQDSRIPIGKMKGRDYKYNLNIHYFLPRT
jgi:hypothetical protein